MLQCSRIISPKGNDMKLYAPKYYKDFKCTADKCTHSCCIGWEIDVDRNTMKKYASLPGDYAKVIRSSIEEGESPHFRLCEGDRCPHLDESGLCRIITEYGERYLCDICREHPRFYNRTSQGIEVGLGMACEEASRIILSSDEYGVILPISDTEAADANISFDSIPHRTRLFGLLSDGSLHYTDKIERIYRSYKLSPSISSDSDWRVLLSQLEYLDPSHKELLACYSSNIITKENYEKQLCRALAYYIFRHCSGAADEREFRSSLGFGLFCERLLCSILTATNEDVISAARIISEELEYSEENTDSIKAEFAFV